MWQLPAPPTSVTGQLWVPPSLTVTVPVGVPLPGAVGYHADGDRDGLAKTTGLGVVLVMLVVVASSPTLTTDTVDVVRGRRRPYVPVVGGREAEGADGRLGDLAGAGAVDEHYFACLHAAVADRHRARRRAASRRVLRRRLRR